MKSIEGFATEVSITEEERRELEYIISKGKSSAIKIKHAHILLKLDESEGKKVLAGTEISKVFDINERTVCQISKRFVEEGMEGALERKKQLNRGQ